MSYPMHILVNDFAIRSFRETADKDYITARMAYRARLIQPFRGRPCTVWRSTSKAFFYSIA